MTHHVSDEAREVCKLEWVQSGGTTLKQNLSTRQGPPHEARGVGSANHGQGNDQRRRRGIGLGRPCAEEDEAGGRRGKARTRRRNALNPVGAPVIKRARWRRTPQKSHHQGVSEGWVREWTRGSWTNQEQRPEPKRGQPVGDKAPRDPVLPKLHDDAKGRGGGLGSHGATKRAGDAMKREVRDRALHGRWEFEPAARGQCVLDLPQEVGLSTIGDARRRERG